MKRLGLLALIQVLSGGPANTVLAEDLSVEREQALRHLLLQDCGSCHGMTLGGGLGPSLKPEDLSTKDIQILSLKILHGMPEKGMPPWRALLSDQDANWLAALIVNGVKQK